MLTGVKPFDAADLTQLLFWVVNLPHKPPSERNPSLPPVIDYVIARALKKEPEARYASAAELAHDLRECIPEMAGAASATMAGDTAPGTVTVPNAATRRITTAERLELRASPRFDSTAALARLPFLGDTMGGTRTGWTAARPELPRRVDRSRALLWGAFALAFLAAVLIVLA
jgi:serine/threonine-protein kinase